MKDLATLVKEFSNGGGEDKSKGRGRGSEKGKGKGKDKNAIEQVFKWYEEHVNSIRNDTAKLRLSAIHNDLNESNVLVTASDWEERVNNDSIDVLNDFACIDFGDICISWTVIEIATAMAYCALATPNAPLES